ncbi:hypothetical protein KFK09_018903 [Dendrobium nobile]|uniref:Retrovirus-related Pol polyprotein from transposon TNT 1-94 n=1 Tax=Dendrobium nobile TaxID=94219 RepID=A0A8T3AX33_DENNO|nr:hypothetical protein KFK09_018903 [Dendrobium nobile]
MSNACKLHWEAVKWILKYLRGSVDKALCFGGADVDQQGYVDFDLVGDLDGRRSMINYIFTLEKTALNWVFKLQKIVALSTTKVEYIAITEASKKMI